MGLSALFKFLLVKQIDVVSNQNTADKFSDCFQSVYCFSYKQNVLLDPIVKPVVNRACRIPLPIENKVKAELSKMKTTTS